MKKVFARILILIALCAVTASTAAAQQQQDAVNNNQAPPNTEVFGENDRLPFMQNQEAQSSNEPSSGGLLLKTCGAMLFIVGLIFFGAWGAKKLGFGTQKTDAADDLNLTIVSTLNLGNGRTISTVRFGERILVVGSTPQSFTLLAEETSHEKISFENSRSVAELLAAEEDDLFQIENDSFAEEFQKAQSILNLRESAEGERI